MNRVPTVVHVTSGNILEAASADVEVRVVRVDHGADDTETGRQLSITLPERTVNYDVTISMTVSATVTVTVQAESAEQARRHIDEQLNQRVSDATDTVHEAFSEIIRKEPLDYTLDVKKTDASGKGGS